MLTVLIKSLSIPFQSHYLHFTDRKVKPREGSHLPKVTQILLPKTHRLPPAKWVCWSQEEDTGTEQTGTGLSALTYPSGSQQTACFVTRHHTWMGDSLKTGKRSPACKNRQRRAWVGHIIRPIPWKAEGNGSFFNVYSSWSSKQLRAEPHDQDALQDFIYSVVSSLGNSS